MSSNHLHLIGYEKEGLRRYHHPKSLGYDSILTSVRVTNFCVFFFIPYKKLRFFLDTILLTHFSSFVQNGVLIIKPTLAADELSDDTIRHGSYQAPGCNMDPCVS